MKLRRPPPTTLGADLRERGMGLRVLEQGIDTATAEGRAMFGMLSVPAKFQRELRYIPCNLIPLV
ncbi:recombinase family protein [Pseudarthrobacter sp. NPDC058362]|uniref:recombinase family protein n=1 Tax=Pseudarthrobacter sp. NPDC058362 TaxID=3346458 RepID=UPI00364BEBA3